MIIIQNGFVDSGASDHMIGNSTLFSTYSPCPRNYKVSIANGERVVVAGKGIVKISNDLYLPDVLHVPLNLISTHKLSMQLKCLVYFSKIDCLLQNLTLLQKSGLPEEENGLYLVNKNKERQWLSSSFHGIKQKGDPPDIWLFGHPSLEVLRKVFLSLVSSFDVTKLRCDVCEIAKHHRVSYSSSEIPI